MNWPDIDHNLHTKLPYITGLGETRIVMLNRGKKAVLFIRILFMPIKLFPLGNTKYSLLFLFMVSSHLQRMKCIFAVGNGY